MSNKFRGLLADGLGRLCSTVMGAGVEFTELVNFIACFNWFVPIYTQNDYLGSSIYLQAVESVLHRAGALWIFGGLGFLQIAAVFFGGRSDGNPPVQTDFQALLLVRQIFSFICAVLWFTLAFLQNTAGFGVGTLQWTWIGLACLFSLWRLQLKKKVEQKVEGFRQSRASVKLAVTLADLFAPPQAANAAVATATERGRDA